MKIFTCHYANKDPTISFYLDTFTLTLFNLDVVVYISPDNDPAYY